MTSGTILHRVLQAVGVLALLLCAQLAWGATPWGGEGWSRARMLYAGAGAVSALALVAIGGIGIALARAEAQRAALERRLAEMQAMLADLARRSPPG
ncbi:hypothetical protein [Paracraurococcus ruber]|uniref:Uncharacterized protein n=1 Tax=Paracraurococcus ruber TaxID=77675 RepID=A0ABS1CUM9_9PROT|nr:hypothetical protein [Paracraurococcus ruber]MBK1658089.1 hypothetical protein [Paracraurococcus ruber]TDG32342.1 hypothetical protein E2C05_07425 [Paracraurococcus ruber]